MKTSKNLSFAILILALTFSTFGCNSNDDDNDNIDPTDPKGSCYVHLFDGDNFKDDNIIVDGPGDFPDLSDLPGAKKNWNDEADSFKAGSNTTVTMWTETGFKGDSTTYKGGAQESLVDEPGSMKIRCK